MSDSVPMANNAFVSPPVLQMLINDSLPHFLTVLLNFDGRTKYFPKCITTQP